MREQAEGKDGRRRDVLEVINEVFLKTLTCETYKEMALTCLNLAEELTGSKFGWIGEVNQAGRLDTIALTQLHAFCN